MSHRGASYSEIVFSWHCAFVHSGKIFRSKWIFLTFLWKWKQQRAAGQECAPDCSIFFNKVKQIFQLLFPLSIQLFQACLSRFRNCLFLMTPSTTQVAFIEVTNTNRPSPEANSMQAFWSYYNQICLCIGLFMDIIALYRHYNYKSMHCHWNVVVPNLVSVT